MTKYNYTVKGKDSWGNLGASDPLSFTTLSIIEDLTQNNDQELSYEEIQKLTADKTEETQKTTLASLLSTANEATQKAASILKQFGSSMLLGTLEQNLLSQDEALQLLSNNLPAPILSGEPRVITTANTATIAWKTNKPANSLVAIAPDGSFKIADNSKEGTYLQVVGNPSEYTEEHVVTIYELTPATLYHYQLKSQPQVGPAAKSDDFTFKTQSELIAITNHIVEITSPEEAVFKWVTNVEADSTLKYTPYRNSRLAVDETRTKYEKISSNIHEISLSDLESGVIYQIELSSQDAGGNQANDIINNFSTAKDDLPPLISQVQTRSAISPGKETKVQTIISWQTNEPSTSRVYYQEGIARADQALANSTPPDSAYAKKHVAVITNFTPGKVYSFRVESIDSGNNTSLSNIYTILAPREQESVFQIIMRNMEEIFGWVGKMR